MYGERGARKRATLLLLSRASRGVARRRARTTVAEIPARTTPDPVCRSSLDHSLADASRPPVAAAAPCGVGKLALADNEYVVAHCMQKSASAGLWRTRSYRCAGSSAP